MSDLGNIVAQNIGAVAMGGAFIYYLITKDKRNAQTFAQFNKSLQRMNKAIIDHGDKDIVVQKEITKMLEQTNTLIRELCKEIRK